MKWLVLALILVPTAELAILIWAGGELGFFLTLAMIISTGLLGAFLAKKQGLKALRDIQDGLNNFQPPGEQLIRAAFILVGATLLLTPGFITDAVGFSLLFTPTQRFYRPLLNRFMQKKMKNTRVIVR
jgi:UPF0716 protein FxsA